jgi:methionyl-tRNA formyltransferase
VKRCKGVYLRIIFAGTPQFAAVALEALLVGEFEVVAVLSQPDRPSGRGMQLTPSPVKQMALRHDLPVLQPQTLKNADIQKQLAAYAADVIVVAAYGLILPPPVLRVSQLGCLNIHASLLPRWRGAAPIQRAILAGDSETGVTIMQMDEGLDTGDMLLKKSCQITPHDNANTLHDKLALLGAEAIVEALRLLEQGNLQPEPQDNAQATYAAKLSKTEAQIKWHDAAAQIERMVRAFNPYPVAQTSYKGTSIKIWQARLLSNLKGEPGTVLSAGRDGIVVACGKGALLLEVMQQPNSRAMSAAKFIQGFPLRPGDYFGPLG